jgi:hypothetical protein
MRMITSVEDCELHGNIDQNVSIYELLKNDIEGKETDSCDTNFGTYDKTISYQAMKTLSFQ